MTCEVATTFVKTFLATNEFQDFKIVASEFCSDNDRVKHFKGWSLFSLDIKMLQTLYGNLDTTNGQNGCFLVLHINRKQIPVCITFIMHGLESRADTMKNFQDLIFTQESCSISKLLQETPEGTILFIETQQTIRILSFMLHHPRQNGSSTYCKIRQE